MGGYINTAIRLADGQTFCQERWTNPTPHWFQDPRMFAGDLDHVMAYVNNVATNDFTDGGALGLPQPVENNEYGLIVFDFQSQQIIDNNHYSSPVEFDPIYTGGDNVKDNFLACARAGLLVRRTYDVSAEKLAEVADRRPYPFEETPLLSPEEAIRLGEEAFREEFGNPRDFLAPRPKRTIRREFYVRSQMTYCWMGDHSDHYDEATGTTPLSAEYLAILKEIGFPMTKADGLNATLPYRDRLPAGAW